MVDGPSLHGDTALGRPVGDSDVVAFGRDLQVSYRVWSPKSGYPGHAAYRDFHTYDHLTGLKPARVTGRNVPSDDKAPYDPERADRAIDVHVADFVDVVRRRLFAESERHRPPGPRRRRVRHRTLRPLVVRGPGVAGTGAAGAARGRRAVGTLTTPSPTDSSAPRSTCRRALGVPARTGRCGPATRSPTWCSSTPRSSNRARHRRQGACADRVAGRADPPRPRRRPDPARDAAHGVQRLAVHGQQGLRRRLRALSRPPACPRDPGDRRRAGVGPPRSRRAAGRDWNRADGLFGALDARRLPR